MKTKIRKEDKEGGSVKKALLLSFLIFGGLVILSIGAAAAAPTVKINPESTTGLSPGDTFSIDVAVNSDTHDLKACKIDLTYNASALTATAVTPGTLLGSPTLTEPGSGITQPGWIHYGITRTSGNTAVPSVGTFITVDFTVNNTAANGTYLLDLSNVTLNNATNDEIPGVEVTDGNVTVGEVTTRPTVKIDPESTPDLSPGDTFSVDIAVNSATYDLKACKIDLTYNASALTATTVTPGTLLGSPTLTEPGSGITQPGWIHYGITRTSGNTAVPSVGTFITVDFTVNGTAASGTYLLDLSNVTLNNATNDEIPDVEVTDGNAIVTAGAPPSQIPLYAGWNLISTPLMPYNDSIENVTADIAANLTSVWAYRYNDTSGSMEWRSYSPVPASNTLNKFEAGWGYWVDMTSADTLTIEGTFFPTGGGAPPPTYDVYTGWNLVGFHSQTDKDASIYLANLGGDWSSLYKYPFGGPYEQISANENMERGSGYWLSMQASGTIAP